MADDRAPQRTQVRLVLRALGRGAAILVISLLAIGVIFFFILAAVMAGYFG